MSVNAAGLAQLARMLGVSLSQDALDRLAPVVSKVYADLDRLRALPIDDRRPALPPLADLPRQPEKPR